MKRACQMCDSGVFKIKSVLPERNKTLREHRRCTGYSSLACPGRDAPPSVVRHGGHQRVLGPYPGSRMESGQVCRAGPWEEESLRGGASEGEEVLEGKWKCPAFPPPPLAVVYYNHPSWEKCC